MQNFLTGLVALFFAHACGNAEIHDTDKKNEHENGFRTGNETVPKQIIRNKRSKKQNRDFAHHDIALNDDRTDNDSKP